LNGGDDDLLGILQQPAYRRVSESVVRLASLGPPHHGAASVQGSQVSGDRRLGHVQALREVRDPLLSVRKLFGDDEARLVGEGAEEARLQGRGVRGLHHDRPPGLDIEVSRWFDI